ncbi:MAG: cysteine--tRNA ligase, partial [Desulfovibrionaceae bacterium]|nr:cysteine--tRNA ligase [Desulfovibrionaceae bacterium]
MQVYNSIVRRKEEFIPKNPGKVDMYVCGITTYDYCHVGHARSAIVFDVLSRYLRYKGFDVRFARNFTDVDDKIINRANKEGVSSQEIAEKFIAAFHEDMDRLSVRRADIEPRATENIPEMIAMCETLIEKGTAYSTPSGDVYFRVRNFPGYGKLSGRSLDEMQAGARIAPGEEKEDPMDFALWKAAKPGEPFWESPWGKGRPGWHIECSVMSAKYLELPLDIHGGGQDLIFPHHENEVAQTEAACSCQFVRYWLHNGFVQIDSEKMSKSLGNFKTIRDILETYQAETLRYFLISRQYRSPIDFSFQSMEDAEKNLKRIYQCIGAVEDELARTKRSGSKLPEEIWNELKGLGDSVMESMDDDLNTAAALGHVFGAVRLALKVLEDKSLRLCADTPDLLREFLKLRSDWLEVFGVFGLEPAAYLGELRLTQIKRKGISLEEIETLLDERKEARKNKDFAASDAIRARLNEMGVEVRDTPAG